MQKSDSTVLFKQAVLNSWRESSEEGELFHFNYRQHSNKKFVRRYVFEHESAQKIVEQYTDKLKMNPKKADVLLKRLQKEMDLSKAEDYVKLKKGAFAFTASPIKKNTPEVAKRAATTDQQSSQ